MTTDIVSGDHTKLIDCVSVVQSNFVEAFKTFSINDRSVGFSIEVLRGIDDNIDCSQHIVCNSEQLHGRDGSPQSMTYKFVYNAKTKRTDVPRKFAESRFGELCVEQDNPLDIVSFAIEVDRDHTVDIDYDVVDETTIVGVITEVDRDDDSEDDDSEESECSTDNALADYWSDGFSSIFDIFGTRNRANSLDRFAKVAKMLEQASNKREQSPHWNNTTQYTINGKRATKEQFDKEFAKYHDMFDFDNFFKRFEK